MSRQRSHIWICTFLQTLLSNDPWHLDKKFAREGVSAPQAVVHFGYINTCVCITRSFALEQQTVQHSLCTLESALSAIRTASYNYATLARPLLSIIGSSVKLISLRSTFPDCRSIGPNYRQFLTSSRWISSPTSQNHRRLFPTSEFSKDLASGAHLWLLWTALVDAKTQGSETGYVDGGILNFERRRLMIYGNCTLHC